MVMQYLVYVDSQAFCHQMAQGWLTVKKRTSQIAEREGNILK